MSLFTLRAFLRYRHTAKGRHGIHSPAVYSFVDRALRPAGQRFGLLDKYVAEDGSTPVSDDLFRRIVHHFRFGEVVEYNSGGSSVKSYQLQDHSDAGGKHEAYRRLHDWRSLVPGQWAELLTRNISQYGSGDVVVVASMYRDEAGSEAWKALCARHEVRLSIDLFRAGLLFFSQDFKERQHFVLRYPL
jgi:hypothetical protein